MCFDGVKRLCHIRGKLRKKVRKRHRLSYHPVFQSRKRLYNHKCPFVRLFVRVSVSKTPQ